MHLYMYIYTCMHVRTHTHTHTNTYINTFDLRTRWPERRTPRACCNCCNSLHMIQSSQAVAILPRMSQFAHTHVCLIR